MTNEDKYEDGQVTEGGATIHRYEESAKSKIEESDSSVEEITAHIEKYIGEPAMVFHELASDYVHVDVHWIQPEGDQYFHTLVTSGMSDVPMNIPEGVENCKYSELVISLPYDWQLSEEAFKDEKNYFPVRLIKQLARFPHTVNAWLWEDHTLPNGDPMEPYAENTQQCCALLTNPLQLPEDFWELKVRDDKVISFFNVFPLYSEEVDYKLKNGSEDLYMKLSKCGTDFVVDPNRKNSCKKRFGLF